MIQEAWSLRDRLCEVRIDEAHLELDKDIKGVIQILRFGLDVLSGADFCYGKMVITFMTNSRPQGGRQ